jgi:hypothetical protein
VTATSRKLLASAAAISLVAAAGGCGGKSYGSTTVPSTSPTVPARTVVLPPKQQLVDLVGTAPVPARWSSARTPQGATLAFAPGWRVIAGDRGTVSAASRDASGRFLGYVNLTPREGAESLANWSSFRPRHNREEGDRRVRLLAAARGLRVAGHDASCVKDFYTTSSGVAYIELACLIGGELSAVVVGAAPPDEWAAQAPDIERSISSVEL